MSCAIFETKSPAETKRIGARLGRLVQAGDVLLLQGELGSGKTMFAQGVGQGLRVREPVKSSSFVLMNEYHGRLTFYHADLYRLSGPLEVADLALEETAAPGLLAVEWPERAWEELPPEHLLVRIEEQGAKGRRLTVAPHGKRYEELVASLLAKPRDSSRGGRP